MPTCTKTARNGRRPFAEEAVAQPEDRIRAVLGVNDGLLPEVGRETLQTYYDYLTTHLSFPFQARYPDHVVIKTVTVIGLLDPLNDMDCESLGIVCKAHLENQNIKLSLADLEVGEEDSNHQLVEDYWYWFWNWQ